MIANDDKTVVWQLEASIATYLSGYYNLDGQVYSADKNERWRSNTRSGSKVPQ